MFYYDITYLFTLKNDIFLLKIFGIFLVCLYLPIILVYKVINLTKMIVF